jgi:hypothetical protein
MPTARLGHQLAVALFLGVTSAMLTAQAPKPKPKLAPTPKTPQLATLLIKTDLPAVVTLDGQPVKSDGQFAGNEIVRKSIPLGEHIIEAVSLDQEDKWREVLNIDKVGQRAVLIELEALRAARLANLQKARKIAEADEAAAQKESLARTERAQREAAERADRERQEAVRRENDQAASALRARIAELERQADAFEAAAATLTKQADQGERDAQRYQAQGNNVLAALAATTAAVVRQESEKRQREAQLRRTTIRQLERELSGLSR